MSSFSCKRARARQGTETLDWEEGFSRGPPVTQGM